MTLIAHLKSRLKKLATMIGIKSKSRYIRVAYGYPAYDLTWCNYEHDRTHNIWRRIRDDFFDEGRPDHFDIDMDIINFEKDITPSEKEYVLRWLRQDKVAFTGST